jgi:hypothetical protein
METPPRVVDCVSAIEDRGPVRTKLRGREAPLGRDGLREKDVLRGEAELRLELERGGIIFPGGETEPIRAEPTGLRFEPAEVLRRVPSAAVREIDPDPAHEQSPASATKPRGVSEFVHSPAQLSSWIVRKY